MDVISLLRPNNTHPCKQKFYLQEEKIFVKDDSPLYRYYILCPHCGYIVRVSRNMLNTSSILRIEKRCQSDR